jgi:serine protease Do
MNLSTFGINCLSSLLTITATVTAIVISQPVVAIAKTAPEVAEIAKQITVQINSELSDGSGFIIYRDNNNYFVLTNNHVVRDKVAYSIRTSDGKKYPVTGGIGFQKQPNDPDLAIVSFNTQNSYPLAILGNSNQAQIGDPIFVYGYPSIGGLDGEARQAEFSPGYITSIRQNESAGYNLRFNAVTWGGMSGGPVLNNNGEVIGVHGRGDNGIFQLPVFGRDGKSSQQVITALPTGFNSAVPINTLIDLISKMKLSPSNGKVDSNLTLNNRPLLSNPQSAEDYYVRGLTRADQGENQEAIADYTKALTMNPSNAMAHLYRGHARYKEGDKQGAIADYNQVIRFNPNNGIAYLYRGFIRYQQGDKHKAIADYNQVIRFNPNNPIVYYNRGIVYFGIEDMQSAKNDFEKATELLQKNGDDGYYQNVLNKIRELQR